MYIKIFLSTTIDEEIDDPKLVSPRGSVRNNTPPPIRNVYKLD